MGQPGGFRRQIRQMWCWAPKESRKTGEWLEQVILVRRSCTSTQGCLLILCSGSLMQCHVRIGASQLQGKHCNPVLTLQSLPKISKAS